MKSLLKYALCLLTFAAAINTADAAVGCERSIVVNGVGKVSANYDLVTLNFEAIAENNEASVAKDKVETIVNNFFANIKAAKLDDKNIKADNINLSPKYNYKDGNSTLVGYIARRSLNVNLTDFSLIAKITDIAMQSGITTIGGFTYSIVDVAKYQKQALDLALADARSKAKQIADGLDIKIGQACSVRYNSNDNSIMPRMVLSKAYSDSAVSNANYQDQSTEVKAVVDVSFIIKG